MSRKKNPVEPETPKDEGVSINLVSSERLGDMTTQEKVRFILDEVEAGKILVLERGLTPQEELQLVEATMSEIDQDTFIGIEMQSYGLEMHRNIIHKWLGTPPRPRMAVIGPANRLTTVHKDSNNIQAKILTAQGITAMA